MATMQLKTVTPADLANISRALVGFDRFFDQRLQNMNGNYPPHNIVKYDENHYGIEVAVAGFSKAEITVEVDQDQLTIKGQHGDIENDTIQYMHRGIAARNFEQTFTLAEYMEVKDAEVKDGMLKISIERIVPEALKPRQIKVK
jgi:molecular chaperone IbpA